MANEEYLKIFLQGAAAWNTWRKNNPEVRRPDLSGLILPAANLAGMNLSGSHLNYANLFGSNLYDVDLSGANVSGAILPAVNFSQANRSGAILSGTNLSAAQLVGTVLRDATLTGSQVYGVSVWDVKVNDGTKQQNLIITPTGNPKITVDNIKVAQFIYLLLTKRFGTSSTRLRQKRC